MEHEFDQLEYLTIITNRKNKFEVGVLSYIHKICFKYLQRVETEY